MKFIPVISLLALFLTPVVYAKKCDTQIRIAVVDTGLNLNDPRFTKHLCATGHKDFTGAGIVDVNTHGTHVAGLIEKYAGNSNYCLLIYKYYTDSDYGELNTTHEVLAFKEAIKNGADIINLSAGGPEFSEQEALVIVEHPKVVFVVAAGNDGKDLDDPENKSYPASLFYNNMFVIGSVDSQGYRSTTSNYGEKVKYAEGENVVSYSPGGLNMIKSGTSMATAIFSGKLVARSTKTCDDK